MHKNRKIKLCKINKNEKGYGQIGTGLLYLIVDIKFVIT